MARSERVRALAQVQNEIATGRLDEIENTLLEWIRDWCTDEDAKSLACQVEDRIESGE